MQSPESQQTISDFENLDLESFNDVNIAVAKFVTILESAAKNFLRLGNIKKKRTRKSQPWYDTECHILKKKLTYISNQKHKDPFGKQIRLSYNFLNKEYKGLLRRKKRNHQDIKMVELTHTNNPIQFWSTLRDMLTKQTKPRDNSIPVDKLYSHFQRLHSKPDPNSDKAKKYFKRYRET